MHNTNVTWERTRKEVTSGSRIDRVYIENKDKINKHIHIKMNRISDHKAVFVEINSKEKKHNK